MSSLVRITVEVISDSDETRTLKKTCDIPIKPGENQLYQVLEHKTSYTAFQFWSEFKFLFKKELQV